MPLRLPRLKTLLALLLGLPAAALLILVVLIPLIFKLSAERVHADAASVPASSGPPADARWAFAAGEAGRLAQAQVAADNLPGLSAAVAVDGVLVWAGGYGWADVAARKPVTPETQFRIGTLSMPLTAAGIGLLVDRGKIELDAPVQRYLPSFPDKGAAISLRQAMAHTAGIRHPSVEVDYLPRQHCRQVAEALRLFADEPLRFAPGTRWEFSAYGWVLASAVAEAAAGQPFSQFMAQQLLAPLGMRGTVPDVAPADTASLPQRARLYWPRARRDTHHGLEHPDDSDFSCWFGAGMYLSTPTDLVRLGLAMDGQRLLSAATTAALQMPAPPLPGGPAGWGLGWTSARVAFGPGQTLRLDHPGRAVGASTVLYRYPEHGLVVAVSSNVTFARVAAYAEQVAALFAAARTAARTAATTTATTTENTMSQAESVAAPASFDTSTRLPSGSRK